MNTPRAKDSEPKFFGVIDGDPFAPDTWSGSSRFLFQQLRNQNSLAAAFDASPRKLISIMLKARNFNIRLDSWRFGYHMDPAVSKERTRQARIGLQRSGGRANCILQIGAWYDMANDTLPVVSYHDGNIACRLESPFGFPPIKSKRIQRARLYERNVYHKLDRIFTMSQWLADSFASDFGIPDAKVVPVFAGINLPDTESLSTVHHEAKNILFVGKDFERKGGNVLLDAFVQLRKRHSNVTLTIVGPKRNLDIPGVQCVGEISKESPEGVSKIDQLYRSASVFALPTLYEPFGIAFAEAMSRGLPCVGSRVCAVPEIVDDGETGLLVAPGSPNALAKALHEILSDYNGAKKMGELGFQKYRQQFRWDRVVEKICHHTRGLL